LVGEEHGSDRLALDFLDEGLAVIGVDQVFDSSFDQVGIEFFVLGFESHFYHECSHGRGVVFLGDLQHLNGNKYRQSKYKVIKGRMGNERYAIKEAYGLN
jgi:hypothetical protein